MSVYNLSCLQFMTKEEKLIWLYLYICGARDRELCMHCQRMSNNYAPKFSDAELITTCLFAIIEQKSLTIKSIHRVISRYWQSWFSEFPSYQKYAFRLNRLSEVFPALVERVCWAASIAGVYQQISLVDSLPIIIAGPKRTHQPRWRLRYATKSTAPVKDYGTMALSCICSLDAGQPAFPSLNMPV